MSKATFTFGRFNPPTEAGHGKLVSAVQSHAEETGGKHYIFPSHTQDAKKNPLTHQDKVGAMKKMFKDANVVSHGGVRTAIDAMKHLESKGHTHVTMVVGSDRVKEFHGLLNKYRTKEYPGIKRVSVVSAGHRDPDAEGAEGMSASKLRELVKAGKKKEFMSHYSDPKLAAHIHDKVKAGMQTESTNPVGIFLIGSPGSGKDYVLNNIFSRFDLTEVQVEHILNGAAEELYSQGKNIVINGALDEEKIEQVKIILEGYEFDHVYVAVTNKVSRLRNSLRASPLPENKRLEKWYRAEKLAEKYDCFKFNNSINLNESSEFEKVFFASEIQKLLERVVGIGLQIQDISEAKTFAPVRKDKESGLPQKYVTGLSASTAKARKAHWKKMSKYSDKDPRAYKPAPGDATAKTKPSKHTIAVRKMMANEAAEPPRPNPSVETVAKKHGVSVADLEKEIEIGVKVEREHTLDKDEARRIAIDHLEEIPDYYTRLVAMEKSAKKSMSEAADKSLAEKAEKSGVSLSTLRKVYRRGVAAWNSGHRPGTTPSQWGHARVNSYINKGKTYHTADKDLREETKVVGSNCANCIHWVKESEKSVDKSELNENGGLKPTGEAYVALSKHADLITLPGKATVKVKALCDHEDINDFVTERMCCAYWDNKDAERPFKGKADVMEEIDLLFERQLEGTDEYRQHAIATTPGQDQKINAPFEPKKFSKFRKKVQEAEKVVDTTPTLKKTRKSGLAAPPRAGSAIGGASAINILSVGKLSEAKKKPMFMPDAPPLPPPPGGHPVPAGYERVKDAAGFNVLRKIREKPATVKEAVEYHLENKISFTENVFRPGSDMFFEMINEAKRLYKEGNYTPKDEWEADMLETEIGEKAIYEGQEVILDYPFEEELNEEDKTEGKGIGKPWREGGGGAVYVRDGGSIRKIRFSQSGMKKKYMDPAATRSFVARHRCLTNKDKTSASYWACRYPRFFSNSGKIWW